MLALFLQPLGFLLIICSILYSLSYLGAHYNADEFFWTKNDERIYNELLEDIFVNGNDRSKDRGVRYYGYRPDDEELRKMIFPYMIDEDEDDTDKKESNTLPDVS